MIETIELFQKRVAAEVLAGKRVDHLFNFGGDDVAPGEFRVSEDSAEDALGEQVLDEHGLNRVIRKVGVDRLAAEQDEALKAGNKFLVGLALFLNDDFDCGGDLGNAAGEVG